MQENPSERYTDTNEPPIDLIALLGVLWRRKLLILLIVAAGSAASVYYALSLDNIYASYAIMKDTKSAQANASRPAISGVFANVFGGAKAEDTYYAMQVLLNDQRFIEQVVTDAGIEKKLFDEYDKLVASDGFKQNHKYLVYAAVSKRISLSSDKKSGFITLRAEDKDPQFAAQLVQLLMENLSARLRKIENQQIEQKIAEYNKEVAATADVELKIQINMLVVELVKQKVLANTQKYYGFDVVSSPYPADLRDKVKPKRSVICVGGAGVSFILAVLIAFVLEFFAVRRKEKQAAAA